MPSGKPVLSSGIRYDDAQVLRFGHGRASGALPEEAHSLFCWTDSATETTDKPIQLDAPLE